MANHELLNIRKRTTNGIRNAIRSGRVVNNAPFGYINVRDKQGKPTLAIDEPKAQIVRMMFYEFVHGVSHQLIIRKARKMGYNYRGNSTFLRMMSNAVYAGLLRLPAGDNQPERMIKAIHEPIISEEMYWAAYAIVSERGRKKVIPSEMFPLRGVLKCNCGRNLTAAFSKGKRYRYGYYTCYKERNQNFRSDQVHAWVEKLLKELSFTSTQMGRIRAICEQEILGKNDNIRQQLERCQSALADLKTKLNGLEEKLINGVINEETYIKWHGKLAAERSTHEAYLRELKSDKHDMLYDLELAFPRLTNMHTLYAKTNLAGKQALLKKVFERGLIYDGAVLRTPYIHPAFIHNYQNLNEKGLLLIEQPEGFLPELRRCTA